MCNCKGWDISYWPDDVITVEQHTCRVMGDCGHSNNTLEQAATTVRNEYGRLYDWYCDANNRELIEVPDEKLVYLLQQFRLWENRTHPDYLYYSKGEEENKAKEECFADCSAGKHLDFEAGCCSVCKSASECVGWMPYVKSQNKEG